MNLGIVGLPQAGKKTIFRLMTGLDPAKAPTRAGIAYGMAAVRDERIDALSAIYKPKKTRYTEFEVALPPDIKPDASRSADWIEPLRQVDALLLVVRAFESDHVFHIAGSIDPARDLETVETELLLADLDLCEKRLARIAREPVKKDADRQREEQALARCQDHLGEGKTLRTLELNSEELKTILSLRFLTLKPLVVVLNVADNVADETARLAGLVNTVSARGAETVCLCATLESEVDELPEEERELFMQDMGITESALSRLTQATYASLGLISFFTVGPDEVRAWTVRRGALAPEAAGRIHSDLQRGFIRADTVAYDDFMRHGDEKKAREANLYRLNGKDYVVKDGDIMEIRFSV